MKSVNFTREPIIETIITSKEGYKLVIRNSKAVGQEEYFVDALEVVSFGNAFFFRSLDRPKSFLVPVTDYEVLEVRETRVVVKHVAVDRNIKIGGGRDGVIKSGRDQQSTEKSEAAPAEGGTSRGERKRERRRQRRRRGGRDEKQQETPDVQAESSEDKATAKPPVKEGQPKSSSRGESSRSERASKKQGTKVPATGMNTLLPPPSKLISESIERYKEQYGIGDANVVANDVSEANNDESLFRTDDMAIDEHGKAVTEILPQGSVSPERLEHVIREEEFIGERTGDTSLEVFPHKEEFDNDKSEGPAFPSMWFPPSSEDDFEDDRYTHPGTIFDANDDDEPTVIEEETNNFNDEEDYPSPIGTSEDIDVNPADDLQNDEVLKAKQGVDPEA